MEIWKDIEGYESLYQVSNLGNVKSLNYNKTKKERLLKLTKNKDGYLQVNLHKEGKAKIYRVHRLVALAFIPNNDKTKDQVNHIDEDKTNNRVENLEWCTREYNHNYGTRTERMAKAKSKKVICVETGEIFNSVVEVERKLGLNKGVISNCCNHKKGHNTCGGYHWEFVEVDY